MKMRRLVLLNLILAMASVASTVYGQTPPGSRRDCCQYNTEYELFCCDDCCTSGDTCTSTQQCKDRPVE